MFCSVYCSVQRAPHAEASSTEGATRALLPGRAGCRHHLPVQAAQGAAHTALALGPSCRPLMGLAPRTGAYAHVKPTPPITDVGVACSPHRRLGADSPRHNYPNLIPEPKSKPELPEPEIPELHFGYDFEKPKFISGNSGTAPELPELPEINKQPI